MGSEIVLDRGDQLRCIKTGAYFTDRHAGKVYTGDLFYSYVSGNFVVNGVPFIGNSPRHVFEATFQGPVNIDFQILEDVLFVPRADGSSYGSVTFKEARCAGEFVAWLEEWYGSESLIMAAAVGFWEVKPGLAWYSP